MIKENELKPLAYYLLESHDSGERLIGIYIVIHALRKGFWVCGSDALYQADDFIVIREVELS